MVVSGTGLRRLCLFLLVLPSLALATCAQLLFPTPGQASVTDPVVGWLRQSALPLRSVEPGGSEMDLAPLRQVVGAARLVGLGEETHGTHEFFALKARLAEFFIGEMGFTTLVMENDWGRSQRIDAYINGAPGSLAGAMAQGLFTSWQTQEYRGLLEWMRAYNASPAHPSKVHVLGMDFQDLGRREPGAVEGYLQMVDARRLACVRRLYAPLLALNAALSSANPTGGQDANWRMSQQQAQQVYDLLLANRQRYIARSSASAFALALHNARVIVQYATYHIARTQDEELARYYQRDTFLAENVAWISEHAAGSHPRLLIWAHDAHIANDTFYGSLDGRNMGGELRARYGRGYVAVGTTLSWGTFRAYTSSGSFVQTVGQLPRDSYNATLGRSGLPLYLLDLDHLAPGPARAWAHRCALLLSYGLGGEDLSAPVLLDQSFDALVHVGRTTPSRPILPQGAFASTAPAQRGASLLAREAGPYASASRRSALSRAGARSGGSGGAERW